MMLSDVDLRKEMGRGIDVSPRPELAAIQPASIDLRLGDRFRVWKRKNAHWGTYRPSERPEMSEVKGFDPFACDSAACFALEPGQFALGTTLETVTVGPELAARIEGKSTLGRCGLVVHATAGFIDPGFKGQITLELYNMSPFTYLLRPGDYVAQICFMMLLNPCERPYGNERGSHYQGQQGPTEPRWTKEKTWE